MSKLKLRMGIISIILILTAVSITNFFISTPKTNTLAAYGSTENMQIPGSMDQDKNPEIPRSEDANFSPPRTESQLLPTDPPMASLINVSPPDQEGYAWVNGEVGSVPGGAQVAIINLNAYNTITTTADVNGEFHAFLYAPPGSSLLIKYDEEGERLQNYWDLATDNVLDGDFTGINGLPGTIIYVGDATPPSGSIQEFSTSGKFGLGDATWAGWWLFGELQVPEDNVPPGLSLHPGDPVTITAQLRVTSAGLNCTGTPTYTLAIDIGLVYVFDGQGNPLPNGIGFTSQIFTPTGLPIEHEDGPEFKPIQVVDIPAPRCLSPNILVGALEYTFNVPPDFPDGIYSPRVIIFGAVPGQTDTPMVQIWYREPAMGFLPLFRVGTPDLPRIPWTLLANYPMDGNKGVQSKEPPLRFAMPDRVRYTPKVYIIPRLDERTGQPLVYRLEPGTNWLSATDRRLPCPPWINLAFPSGTLVIEVQKPDGSVDILGPASLQQSLVRTPTLRDGTSVAEGTGQIGDMFHLTTMQDAFAYTFTQYGTYVVRTYGVVYDINSNVYPLDGTYEINVARILDLDPGQLPTTPYKQGDTFSTGVHIFPPVPAMVEVMLIHIPYSTPGPVITGTVVMGPANPYGYFQPDPRPAWRFYTPGEFRVDITARYTAPDGTLWMGAMTWGNVVEGLSSLIEAHGRRGMDYKSDTIDDMSPWFFNADLYNFMPSKFGIENYYPYFGGDIHWGDQTPDRAWKGDSIHSIITIKDLTASGTITGTVYDLMKSHYSKSRTGFRWPPVDNSINGLLKRLAIGEAPLFITTESGIDAEVDPYQVDLWGYWYGTSERPDVHVREIISEDYMSTAYWRFNDTYGYQISEPANGDQEGDFKWEFGGAVFRHPSTGINQYAIYSSFWVLLPDGDPLGARVTAPFNGTLGVGPTGGPIMTLLGEDINMLFLPKGVRPGDILEVGDTIAFSGHVASPLDSRVTVTITAPSGAQYLGQWHANKIGWLYDPDFNFPANEIGRWTVDVVVLHDRPLAYAGAPTQYNTGTVLGTSGQYEFYVVPHDFTRLWILTPKPGYITWTNNQVKPIHIRGMAPPGTTAVRFTIHDKGIVMWQGSVIPDSTGLFTVTYDAEGLHTLFPMLSLTAHDERRMGLSDEVEINLLAMWNNEPRAVNTVTLIGEEVFIGYTPLTIYLPLMVNE